MKIKILLIVLLPLCFIHASSEVKLTFRGFSSSPSVLADFENERVSFRFSVTKKGNSFALTTVPYFRIKASEHITLGEFSKGKILKALDSDKPEMLSFGTVFSEPSSLSFSPSLAGITYEDEHFAAGTSFPSVFFTALGNDSFFFASEAEGVGLNDVGFSALQINWSEQKMSGINIKSLFGFNSKHSLGELGIESSSYIKGSYNGRGTPSFSVTAVLEASFRKNTAGIGRTQYGSSHDLYYFKAGDSKTGIEFSLSRIIGEEPVYGMTAQYMKTEEKHVFRYGAFEFKTVYEKTNRTDNAEISSAAYTLSYKTDAFKAEAESTFDMTGRFSISTFSLSFETDNAKLSFDGKKIRLSLSYSVETDSYSFRITADQDRVLTLVLVLKDIRNS